MNTCAICQRNRSTFSIALPVEDSDGELETKHVCGSCIDIITTLAARPILIELESRLSRLEMFTGVRAPEPMLEQE